MGPRFPSQNSFEFVYGQKWKDLYEMEKQRRAALEDELKEARKRLEQDMELAYQDYQAQMLREGNHFPRETNRVFLFIQVHSQISSDE